jgi:hypothetical protein
MTWAFVLTLRPPKVKTTEQATGQATSGGRLIDRAQFDFGG